MGGDENSIKDRAICDPLRRLIGLEPSRYHGH